MCVLILGANVRTLIGLVLARFMIMREKQIAKKKKKSGGIKHVSKKKNSSLKRRDIDAWCDYF